MKQGPSGNEEVKAAAAYIRTRADLRPSVGVVLGSGLGAFGEKLTRKQSLPYTGIPGFPVSTVPGHLGQLFLGFLKGKEIAVLQGRSHLYEGYTATQVTFPVQVLAALGSKVLIVTSAAGAVSERFSPGDVMLVCDHINLQGDNPLRGLVGQGRSRFVDMAGAYEPSLMETASAVAGSVGIHAERGVLASVLGPSYETPAEGAMLRSLGADAVCMSAVPEVIMARYLGLSVLGLVLITNTAAPSSGSARTEGRPPKLEHDQVLKFAAGKVDRFSKLLEGVIEAIGNER